jgi:hypothetical protein
MKKIFIAAFVVFFSLGLAAGTAFGQLTPTGRITGKVVDNQGNPLPGVTVEATNPKLVGIASTVTDLNGTFRLMALPSGYFQVTFKMPGFKTLIRKGLYLELSQTMVLNVALEQAAIEEQITVVGQSPLIDVKSTVKGMTMVKEIFMSLPRGRNFDSLISTIPGVQNESITAGLSVDGASGAENMWYADGADITDFHYGDRGQSIVLELLDEVKVTASGYNAEYGGSMGGVINVITRSGSNEFHGEILGYYENNRQYMQGKSRTFLRRDPFGAYVWEYVNYDDLYYNGGKDRDKYDRYEAVFGMGGYIIKDKLWFYGSFNPTYNQTAAQRDFSLRKGPFQTFTTKNNGLGASVRISAAPLTGLRLSASFINSFSKYRGALPTIIGNGVSTYEWGKEGFDYPNLSASLTADYSIGNNLLISYRAGWHEQNQNNQQIAPPDASTYYFANTNSMFANDPYFVAHPDLLQLTGWTSSTLYQETKNYLRGKIGNNLDVSFYLNWMGEHALKAGVGYNYIYEDRFTGYTHPRVSIYWGQTTNDLEFAIGAKADPSSPYYGKYGYYLVRSSFTSPSGSVWNVKSNNLSVYLQDSWTIKDRLTFNIGIRAESQYMPSFTDNTSYEGWSKNPVKFGLDATLAPRVGVSYDVFGDSSLKIFASYGIYYDLMKLYMGQLTFGGTKRVEDYYALQDPDWTKIAASGKIDDAASQKAGNTYAGSMDYLPPSLNRVDPDIKPTSQREISFGAEKKLGEDISLTARFVQKHLIRTIEDVGVYITTVNPTTGTVTVSQDFWVTNPGYGVSLPISQGGKFIEDYWSCPKATREYYGLNISLEKRFSNNWQGGINYTLSRVSGNYSGLASSDEGGRLGPSVEQDFDRWFMGYDGQGKVLDGPLPQDRTHYFKAFGSYTFPFGLTVGIVGYGRSGLPQTTKILYNSKYFYVNGRADLGRLPFTAWADVYLDYALKIGNKLRASINLQVNNITDTDTIQSKVTTADRQSFTGYTTQILDGTFARDYMSIIASRGIAHPAFNQWETRFAPWSARLGFKLSF